MKLVFNILNVLMFSNGNGYFLTVSIYQVLFLIIKSHQIEKKPTRKFTILLYS